MNKKIKDIEFAFFSQLAYVNWNKINIKNFIDNPNYKDKKFMNFLTSDDVWSEIKKDDLKPYSKDGLLVYKAEDRRLFGVYGIKYKKSSLEENNNGFKEVEPLYDFDGWQFIYSADKKKLYKDKYDVEIEDDGFYACAFVKDNNIVIAYRGTEPDTLRDLSTDFKIGFLNHNHSQLVCAYLFLEYVKLLYPKKEIHITGHSLGGCLAQYAFVCSNKRYPTVTWNGLELGAYRSQLNINNLNSYFKINEIKNSYIVINKIKEKYLDTEGIILLTNEMEDKDYLYKLVYNHIQNNLAHKVFFGTSSDGEINEAKRVSLQIYWLLRSVSEIQKTKGITSSNIKNYYNSKDWTADLQTREGKIIDVITGIEIQNEEIDDSKKRIMKEAPGFDYHGINDFLLYMNKIGNIEPGKLNEIFFSNSIKTVYLKISNEKKKNIMRIEGNKAFKKQPFKGFKKNINLQSKFSGTEKTPLEECKFFYPELLLKEKENNEFGLKLQNEFKYKDYKESVPVKEAKEKAIGEYTVGSLNNIDVLCGIEGGIPLTLYQYMDEEEVKQMENTISYIKEIDEATARALDKKYKETNIKTYNIVTDSGGKITNNQWKA